MKIGFFCDAYTPTRNGVAISAAGSAAELRRRGHEVVIFAPNYRGHADPDETVVRFPAVPWYRSKDFALALPVISSPLVLPLFARQEAFFAAQNFDVVHTHSPFTIGTIGARWAQRHGVPMVFTFHTLYHRYLHYAPLPIWYSRPYTVNRLRRHARLCRHVIAPSQAIARRIGYFCPNLPVTVLPTGIDLACFQTGDGSAVRARLGISDDEIVLLYAGRIAAEKNLPFLLEAVAPLLGKNLGQARVRLLLVGGGPLLEAMKSLSKRLKVAEDVIFTGFVAPKDMPSHFAAGNIFVFASRTETQGVSIAEAQASGLPCVVVGALGAAEGVSNGVTGLVTGPKLSEFRFAVARLLQDFELRAAMTLAATDSARNFSIVSHGQRLEAVYRQIVE